MNRGFFGLIALITVTSISTPALAQQRHIRIDNKPKNWEEIYFQRNGKEYYHITESKAGFEALSPQVRYTSVVLSKTPVKIPSQILSSCTQIGSKTKGPLTIRTFNHCKNNITKEKGGDRWFLMTITGPIQNGRYTYVEFQAPTTESHLFPTITNSIVYNKNW